MEEARVEEMSLADWQRNLAVNLTAPLLMIRAALPHLRRRRGTIVNVGSIEGLGSNPGHAAYCASKAGLHGLTRAVAVDHGAEGIRCNAVAPGWVDTDLNIEFIESMPDPEAFRRDLGRIHPVGRTGQPGGGGGIGGLARLRGGELRHWAGLDRGWGKDGATEPPLKLLAPLRAIPSWRGVGAARRRRCIGPYKHRRQATRTETGDLPTTAGFSLGRRLRIIISFWQFSCGLAAARPLQVAGLLGRLASGIEDLVGDGVDLDPHGADCACSPSTWPFDQSLSP